MHYSKTHLVFSERMRLFNGREDSLTHPDKYIWPDSNLVLDFWNYLDTLTHDDLDKMRAKVKFTNSVRSHTLSALAEEVVGEKVLRCVQLSTGSLVYLATCELISHHRLKAKGQPLQFVTLFDNFEVKGVRPYHLLAI